MPNTIVFFVTFAKGLAVLSPILAALLGIVVINGLIIGRREGWRRGDALYHAFINATTVGYGDFRPTTGLTKTLAILNAFVGLLLTGVFVGVGVFAVQVAVGVPPS
ncbi:MAG: ion channel [Marinibacterium sp.]